MEERRALGGKQPPSARCWMYFEVCVGAVANNGCNSASTMGVIVRCSGANGHSERVHWRKVRREVPGRCSEKNILEAWRGNVISIAPTAVRACMERSGSLFFFQQGRIYIPW